MLHKPWILYIILAWSTNPLLPHEQKTLLVEFKHLEECIGVSEQIEAQIKGAQSMFWLKANQCAPCIELYKDACPKEVKPKGKR